MIGLYFTTYQPLINLISGYLTAENIFKLKDFGGYANDLLIQVLQIDTKRGMEKGDL